MSGKYLANIEEKGFRKCGGKYEPYMLIITKEGDNGWQHLPFFMLDKEGYKMNEKLEKYIVSAFFVSDGRKVIFKPDGKEVLLGVCSNANVAKEFVRIGNKFLREVK